MGLTNIEGPDEMQHNAAFHQGLHCVLRLKQTFKFKEGQSIFLCWDSAVFQRVLVGYHNETFSMMRIFS